MLLNSWAIALLVCAAGGLFLVGLASFTAIKVLVMWDSNSDSEKQIELEGQTWLSAALVQFGLIIQVLSLVVLVMAADNFAHLIAGAMCATGSFLANEYGTKALLIKIAGIFLYGFWVVLHRLDMRSEFYPLVRIKYVYLIILLPLLVLDSYWILKYLMLLEPDVITSCCGVIFKETHSQDTIIAVVLSPVTLVYFFYFSALLLVAAGFYMQKGEAVDRNRLGKISQVVYGGGWVAFFFLSLAVITLFFSSYIYAMPSHNCPFDMMQKQHNGVGYPIYLSLFSAAFLAISGCLVDLFRKMPGLASPVTGYRNFAIKASLWLTLIFLVLVTYWPLRYLLAGGEA